MAHSLPRYYQLREVIREKIISGAWPANYPIPSERILGETYGLSRMTARQALTTLVNEGLVRREQGRGSFVAQPKMVQQLTSLTSFTEDMQARGKTVTTRVLHKELDQANATTAEKLQIKEGQRIFRVERLRLADGEPLAIEEVCITFIGCEKLLDDDLERTSLYRLLETKYDLPLLVAEQEIEATLADEAQARLLDINIGAPLLTLRRTTYTERNQPLEYVIARYRADKYRFYSRLTGERRGTVYHG